MMVLVVNGRIIYHWEWFHVIANTVDSRARMSQGCIWGLVSVIVLGPLSGSPWNKDHNVPGSLLGRGVMRS